MASELLRAAGSGTRFGQGGIQTSLYDDDSDAITPFLYRENITRVRRTIASGEITFIMPPPDAVEIGNCLYIMEDNGAEDITLALGVGDTNTLINGVNADHVLPAYLEAQERITFIYSSGVGFIVTSVRTHIQPTVLPNPTSAGGVSLINSAPANIFKGLVAGANMSLVDNGSAVSIVGPSPGASTIWQEAVGVVSPQTAAVSVFQGESVGIYPGGGVLNVNNLILSSNNSRMSGFRNQITSCLDCDVIIDLLSPQAGYVFYSGMHNSWGCSIKGKNSAHNTILSGEDSHIFCFGEGQNLLVGRRGLITNHRGCCLLLDAGGTTVSAAIDHEFVSRYQGGYRLYSNGGATIGVSLAAGGNSWVSVSDVNLKENLMVCPSVLDKLELIPIYKYNFIGQPIEQVCIGATAQDWNAQFGAADTDTFGVDEVTGETIVVGTHPAKNPLGIEIMDTVGVLLCAVKELHAEVKSLKNSLANIKANHPNINDSPPA